MTGWPAALWLVRHGESEGNLAHARAYATRAHRLDIDVNDIDVPLSELGGDQAASLGRWLGRQPPEHRPTHVVVSPYTRARQTAALALAAGGLDDLPLTVDERLRDREQGVLDRLTWIGISDQLPEEAERRRYVGKFWYRPPGGESWADVALRIRAVLLELRLSHAGHRVLLVTHDVPLIMTCYVLDPLTVEESLALSGQVRNCSVTRYDEADGGMRQSAFNDTTPLDQDDAAVVTAHE